MTPLYKPTFLYVKQHAITCLKYFGNTNNPDPDKYLGSGTEWNRHLAIHGREHVITWWMSDPYFYKEDLMRDAKMFSNKWDVAKSDEWADLVPEAPAARKHRIFAKKIRFCSICERPSTDDVSGCRLEECEFRFGW